MRRLNITTLDAGRWYDRDVLLLHAAFQILVDFVEKEELERITDFEHDEEQRRVWAEIQSLYRWWKTERVQRHDPYDDLPDEDRDIRVTPEGELILPSREERPDYWAAADESQRLEREWFEEDQRNLHRLIDIRPDLWT